MVKQIIFSDSIFISEITDNKIEEKINYILNQNKTREKQNIRSNVNGDQIQFKDTYLSNIFTNKAVQILTGNYNLKKGFSLTMGNMWINLNPQKSYNSAHTHPQSNFSGCFYINPSNDGGDLVFLRNDKCVSFTDNDSFFEGSDFNDVFTIKPKKNLFVLFSSHLTHLVTPQFSSEDRVSISFNFSIK